MDMQHLVHQLGDWRSFFLGGSVLPSLKQCLNVSSEAFRTGQETKEAVPADRLADSKAANDRLDQLVVSVFFS